MEEFLKRHTKMAVNVPEILYHYTPQVGLLGIIKSKEIWMTHTQYLNDTKEFHHAIELVKAEIKLKLETASEDESQILNEMLDGLEPDLSTVNICITCFSEVGDSLSQWRAYGSQMSSYSIGFCGSFLDKVSITKKCRLVKCIYDADEKKALISDFVARALSKILKDRSSKPDEETENWTDGAHMLNSLISLAPTLKDSSFADEKEWRIISPTLSCKSEGFDYREGGSMIIPYFKLPLKFDDMNPKERRIPLVYVGPTPNKEQSVKSVKSLLLSNGFGDYFATSPDKIKELVKVLPSSVPYRSW